MRVIIFKKGILLGEVERADGGGWFAYLFTEQCVQESFWRTKKDALQHVKGGAR